MHLTKKEALKAILVRGNNDYYDWDDILKVFQTSRENVQSLLNYYQSISPIFQDKLNKIRTKYSLHVKKFCDQKRGTSPEGRDCDSPYGCCSDEECKRVLKDAIDQGLVKKVAPYMVDEPIDGMLFMTPSGCALPPKYRPICADYCCQMLREAFVGEADPKYLRSRLANAQTRVENLRSSIAFLESFLSKENPIKGYISVDEYFYRNLRKLMSISPEYLEEFIHTLQDKLTREMTRKWPSTEVKDTCMAGIKVLKIFKELR